MAVIEVNNLTKDYDHGRGIYDVSFEVNKGETLGFLGPNGAGKSTTMRHLMGFAAPQKGNAKILGMGCRKEYAKILENIGYLPGEVTLPEGLNGYGFIDMMQGLRKAGNQENLKKLTCIFEVDLQQKVKRMSIGEKRKLAVIAAFINDPEILLLDEPTSGLDPVMQEKFIEFIREEKKRGKTILLSSHMFAEVEALCDRIAIIKDGRIVSVVEAAEVKHGLRKIVEITFKGKEDYKRFLHEKFEFERMAEEQLKVDIVMEDSDVNEFLAVIVDYEVESFVENPVTLEEYFMHFYKNDRKFGGVSNGKNH
ncbi:ABC-2 type transport system ATP-binding protein [Anaerocolumna jejuensis DSM 15929]|uniref:ABC-2 type transport system ATP-binding protein n=1 Tax=Anaerocolumna jejuensis DSM 15929 TaxID=1121322 RepID=A0A1M6NY86_9FIRM|nr:ABC transporter ATP-binding protein [Anaerocolumna jejuensis]SHK00707.1 ABC-2 type transport system ATP-binding protein [Anaerocolumna jejuensis DSM 15929]